MHFKVRANNKSDSKDVDVDLPRMAKIRQLQDFIQDQLDIPIKSQKLFFKGKRLAPSFTLREADINSEDVVQLYVMNDVEDVPKISPSKREPNLVEALNRYYKVADLIEACDDENGAWWDAKITAIYMDVNSLEDTFFFKAHYDWNDPLYTNTFTFNQIRPRSYYVYKKKDLKKGMIVLANYNLEEPSKRGYWYDFQIGKLGKRLVTGSLLVGLSRQPIEKRSVRFTNEIMRIERATRFPKRKSNHLASIPSKRLPFYCDSCSDQGEVCFNCGCYECGGKNDEPSIMLCDECDNGYHLKCLNPPLAEVPDDLQWFCPECKNPEMRDVADNIEEMDYQSVEDEESTSDSLQKHSNNMKFLRRSKVCTIVPVNHFGHVPGVDVGTCWKFRIQASEAGVHRPTMAGIHGNAKEGAYSIVLSSGYEDDEDYGDEFLYTGSGGRDKKQRMGKQCTDQTLTRSNRALALNCDAPLDDEKGAKAENWRAGKPIRVLRNCKAAIHSKFAPKDGNRYDGIYKVVEYFPKRGKSGFMMWVFLLRRDDSTPPPWSPEGREFPVIYPTGYFEAESSANHRSYKRKQPKSKMLKAGNKKSRRTRRDAPKTYKEKFFGASPPKKKPPPKPFKLSGEIQRSIKLDVQNSKLWDECLKSVDIGKNEFFAKIRESFSCICCHEMLFQPVTTKCSHNICKQCLAQSIRLGAYTCPFCRAYIGRKRKLVVNTRLRTSLTLLFRGYDKYRE